MAPPRPGAVRALIADALDEVGVPEGALVLAAVSGGQDSVCLLHALATVYSRRPGRLLVVHVDHRLRGAESAVDAAFVAGMAKQLALRCVTISVNTAEYARQHRLGLEEAARNLRYQTIARVAGSEGAWAAATGHTVDDLAETLLINIVRGTGPTGTSGLTPLTTLPHIALGPAGLEPDEPTQAEPPNLRVVRPLLRLQRSDTAQYCALEGLPFRTDVSNLDPRFLRNRVRHHLVPLLRTYNPNIIDALSRFARLTADDEAALSEVVESVWRSTARVSSDEVAFTWSDWLAYSAAIQRRLLRRSIAELGGTMPSFRTLEAARVLLAARRARRQLALGGGMRLETSRAGVRLVRATAASGEAGDRR